MGSVFLRTSPSFSISYENDWIQSWLPIGDGGDRTRTAALRFEYNDFAAGFNLFTGETNVDRHLRSYYGYDDPPGFQGTYIEDGNTREWRLGAVYVGYKNYRVGLNSQSVIKQIQGIWFHDRGFRFRLFDYYDLSDHPYINYQTKYPFSAWSN